MTPSSVPAGGSTGSHRAVPAVISWGTEELPTNETVVRLPRSAVVEETAGPPETAGSTLIGQLFPTISEPGRPIDLQDVAGLKIAHFRLIRRLGVGGMGSVFLAEDEILRREVALKVLSPWQSRDESSVARFRNEARSAASLDHDNVARVYYSGEDRGLYFIAYEYVEGTNLRDIIRRRGKLDCAEAVHYTLQVAGALSHLAAHQVVHRDIKPSNILITRNGRAKLVDLGLARSQAGEESAELTVAGTTLGTFDYISPEQAKDPRTVDVRSDLYSLGCSLYHMLTGEPPYPEGTVLQKLLDHQGKDSPDPALKNRRVTPQLSQIVRRMMASDPRKRYQTADELIRDLSVAGFRLGLKPTGPLAPAAPRPPVRAFFENNAGWLAMAATLLLGVLLLERFPQLVRFDQGDPLVAEPPVSPTQTAARTPPLQGGARDPLAGHLPVVPSLPWTLPGTPSAISSGTSPFPGVFSPGNPIIPGWTSERPATGPLSMSETGKTTASVPEKLSGTGRGPAVASSSTETGVGKTPGPAADPAQRSSLNPLMLPQIPFDDPLDAGEWLGDLRRSPLGPGRGTTNGSPAAEPARSGTEPTLGAGIDRPVMLGGTPALAGAGPATLGPNASFDPAEVSNDSHPTLPEVASEAPSPGNTNPVAIVSDLVGSDVPRTGGNGSTEIAMTSPATRVPDVSPSSMGTGTAKTTTNPRVGTSVSDPRVAVILGGKSFETLEAACVAAKSGDVIELRYDGRKPQPERPLRIAGKQLTVRAGRGFRPLVSFAPADSLQSHMITIAGGSLTAVNLDVELRIPDTVMADRWTVFTLERAEKLLLENCVVTVLNSRHVPAAVIEQALAPGRATGGLDSMRMATGPSIDVNVNHSVIRGTADFVALRDTAPARYTVENSLIAVEDHGFHTFGQPDVMGEVATIHVSFSHVTMLSRGAFLTADTMDEFSERLTPLTISARNSIFAVGPRKPFLERSGGFHGQDAREIVEWTGERNYFDAIDPFWSSPDSMTQNHYDDWKRLWGASELSSKNVAIEWRGRWMQVPFEKLLPGDAELDTMSDTNAPVAGAGDGLDAGAPLSALPVVIPSPVTATPPVSGN